MSMNLKKLIAVCVLCLSLAVMPAVAQWNSTSANETNVTATVTATVMPMVMVMEMPREISLLAFQVIQM